MDGRLLTRLQDVERDEAASSSWRSVDGSRQVLRALMCARGQQLNAAEQGLYLLEEDDLRLSG